MRSEEKNALLADWYERYYDTVYLYCASYVAYQAQYRELIEDCVQDAFLKALTHFEDFEDYKNPMGWIAEAAMNRFRSELRKQRRHERKRSPIESAEDAAQLRTDVERWAERHDAQATIDQLVPMLTGSEREVFEAYFASGLSTKETAAQTGRTSGSVRAAIARIRRRARSTEGREAPCPTKK